MSDAIDLASDMAEARAEAAAMMIDEVVLLTDPEAGDDDTLDPDTHQLTPAGVTESDPVSALVAPADTIERTADEPGEPMAANRYRIMLPWDTEAAPGQRAKITRCEFDPTLVGRKVKLSGIRSGSLAPFTLALGTIVDDLRG